MNFINTLPKIVKSNIMVVTVELFALLPCIWEVPGLNIFLETGYLDEFVVVFLSLSS
jgi:hypothetical protein